MHLLTKKYQKHQVSPLSAEGLATATCSIFFIGSKHVKTICFTSSAILRRSKLRTWLRSGRFQSISKVTRLSSKKDNSENNLFTVSIVLKSCLYQAYQVCVKATCEKVPVTGTLCVQGTCRSRDAGCGRSPAGAASRAATRSANLRLGNDQKMIHDLFQKKKK